MELLAVTYLAFIGWCLVLLAAFGLAGFGVLWLIEQIEAAIEDLLDV